MAEPTLFEPPDAPTGPMTWAEWKARQPLPEWEFPREPGADWPEEAAVLLREYWRLRRECQAEIDASIQRHAETVYLYDQPYTDPKRQRVAGPFCVETPAHVAARPAPAVTDRRYMVQRYAGEVTTDRGRYRVFHTGDDRFYLFCPVDAAGADLGLHQPVAKADLRPEVRSALGRGLSFDARAYARLREAVGGSEREFQAWLRQAREELGSPPEPRLVFEATEDA